jgi:autoinducer 2 (AI-2) kinase
VRDKRVTVLDAGTSCLRAISVDAAGGCTTLASYSWAMFQPGDGGPFAREIGGERLTSILAGCAEAAGEPAAIACTGQREGVVFCDEQLTPVLVSPNIDARAAAEGMAVDATQASAVYGETGHLPSLLGAPPKFAWLRQHRPDDAARVRWALPLADWIAGRLTGAPAMSRTLASEVGVRRVVDGAPPSELFQQTAFDPGLVAPVLKEGATSGEVRRGSLAGTPVMLAGGDTQAAMIGMGCVAPGHACVTAGWCAPVQLVTETPLFDEKMRTWTGRHVVDGSFVLESNAGEAGRAYAWLCKLFGLNAGDADALAAAAPAGAGDVLAVMGARAMDAAHMTATTGAIALPLPLVMAIPDRGELLRAVLESIAYAIRANIEQLELVSGGKISSLRLGGGMARSEVFAQILADVSGRALLVTNQPETTAVGAAVLAAAAAGLHASPEQALAGMTHHQCVEPDMKASASYDDGYDRWTALAASLEALG